MKRITPACAGNSAISRRQAAGSPDHPRVCGEQRIRYHIYRCRNGSPPRVRGTARLLSGVKRAWGITPACAGNRARGLCFCAGREDHPRVCGKQNILTNNPTGPEGSPPRVRGTARLFADIGKTIGITPACAGNSIIGSIKSLIAEDHPRVCGEQEETTLAYDRREGSPPRVRGTARLFLCPAASCGITPACAGNSFHQSHKRGTVQDHPRVCGEQ